MERDLIGRIARTVLYEGYALYPYRQSSLKNSRRCAFGVLYPESWKNSQRGSDRSDFTTEVLLRGTEATRVSVIVRFLQFAESVMEREVSVHASPGALAGKPRREPISFGSVEGEVELSANSPMPGLCKLTLTVRNVAAINVTGWDEALTHSLASAHALITAEGGSFISLTDPPADFSDLAHSCVNNGVWPVLVGASGTTDAMLASPVILPDYPQLAPESPGDLFDATEIDEILTLRVLTLTDAEKAELRASDQRVRQILERSESLSSQHLMNLHGTIRGMSSDAPLAIGDRVRLRPAKSADIFDIALAGRIAIIVGIEEDFEGQTHVAVVVEDDPGKDLGEMRYIGHRFFFSPAEIEPLSVAEAEVAP